MCGVCASIAPHSPRTRCECVESECRNFRLRFHRRLRNAYRKRCQQNSDIHMCQGRTGRTVSFLLFDWCGRTLVLLGLSVAPYGKHCSHGTTLTVLFALFKGRRN
jgi:hypothetical protein